MERTVGKSGRLGSITFWGWVVSLFLHIILLSALAVVKFSKEKAYWATVPAPEARIERIKRLLESQPVIPKPKISDRRAENPSRKTKKTLPLNRAAPALEPTYNPSDLRGPSSSKTIGVNLPGGRLLAEKPDFSVAFSRQRKVCFVVDCSGSMQGIFAEVLARLKKSIANLQPDQYFYIIFFGAENLFESGTGRLIRASDKAKSHAYNFIKTVRPGGRTNTVAALKRAMQVSGPTGNSAEVIYLLTDGFELIAENAQGFLRDIATSRYRLAPNTKINTIGFWPQPKDFEVLEAIAEQNGGQALRINY